MKTTLVGLTAVICLSACISPGTVSSEVTGDLLGHILTRTQQYLQGDPVALATLNSRADRITAAAGASEYINAPALNRDVDFICTLHDQWVLQDPLLDPEMARVYLRSSSILRRLFATASAPDGFK